MPRMGKLLIILWFIGICGGLGSSQFIGQAQKLAKNPPKKVPKIWDDKLLATWSLPLAGIGAKPHYVSEKEYYALPVDNLRTYPVYHPDFEPKGYRDWLKQQGAQLLIEPEKIQTEADWVQAGQRVFDELDVPETRSDDPAIMAYISDREVLKRDGLNVTKDGILPALRWVVDRDGKLKISLPECTGCHVRVMDNGALIRGAQGNENLAFEGAGILFGKAFERIGKSGRKLLPLPAHLYASYGVPWIKNDIHERIKKMTDEEAGQLDLSFVRGAMHRFNGSPYYPTKIPDLNGIKDRRYLDNTGTHLNRGPEDLARYAILVSRVDANRVGPYQFLTPQQRLALFRYSDEAMYALGKYLWTLEPPPSPYPFDNLAARGKQIFDQQACATCHAAPFYTSNKLTPATEFIPPKAHLKQYEIFPASVGTDSGLALKTRKGTGYYKVPSLRGLWYRGPFEHSGSIATLEDWFDPKRLRDDYVPTGWKGPGVTSRAVKGHTFGQDLSPEDKRALIAFLKTL